MTDRTEDPKEAPDLWHLFTSRFAVPLLTASLGFGSAELFNVQQLRDKVNYIAQHSEHTDIDLAKEVALRTISDSQMREHADKAMDYVTGLLEKVIAQNTELISLIKVQQQMAIKP